MSRRGASESSGNAQLHIRVSPWVKTEMERLIDGVKHPTFGHVVSWLVKRHVDGEMRDDLSMIPSEAKTLEAYYPVLSSHASLHKVWAQLPVMEKKLCAICAFFPNMTGVRASELAGSTVEQVEAFRVSDVGISAMRIGQERILAINEYRFWQQQIRQAFEPEHKLSRNSQVALSRRFTKNRVEVKHTQAVTETPINLLSAPERDQKLIALSEEAAMTPTRYLHLYAQSKGIDVLDVVSEVLHHFKIDLPEQQRLPERPLP